MSRQTGAHVATILTTHTAEVLANLKPERVVPLVAFLCHDSTEETGKIYETGAGWYGLHRWQRSKGAVFKTDNTFTPAAVKARWDQINDFSECTYPANITDTDYTVRRNLSVALASLILPIGLPRGVEGTQGECPV